MLAKGSDSIWAKYLELQNEKGELTLAEMQLWTMMKTHGMLVWIQKTVDDTRQGVDHIEGMTGAFDQTLAELIRQIGSAYGITYPGSSTIRAALDLKRDVEREASSRDSHEKFKSLIERTADPDVRGNSPRDSGTGKTAGKMLKSGSTKSKKHKGKSGRKLSGNE